MSALAGYLEKVAVVQLAGPEAAGAGEEGAQLQELAASLAPDLVQLMYQIAVTGRRDLTLAPDLRTGFEVGNPRAVLDGGLDGFIDAYLRMKLAKGEARVG